MVYFSFVASGEKPKPKRSPKGPQKPEPKSLESVL